MMQKYEGVLEIIVDPLIINLEDDDDVSDYFDDNEDCYKITNIKRVFQRPVPDNFIFISCAVDWLICK